MFSALDCVRRLHRLFGMVKVATVPRMQSRAHLLLAGILWMLLAPTSGCALGEITAAEGDDVLIVEAHLQAGQVRQFAQLHRSLQGRVSRGETGAMVTLTTPGGRTVQLVETSGDRCAGSVSPEIVDSLEVRVACYSTVAPVGLLVEPGGTYELEVVSSRGEHLRGRTTVPGAFSFHRPPFVGSASFPACSIAPRSNLPLVWSTSSGARSYFAMIEVSGLSAAMQGSGIEAPDRLELTGLSIGESDTTLVLPADFGLFELTHVKTDLLIFLQDGFPAGVTVRLRLSALDRNYVNAIRGGSFNPSGATRISSMIGDGVGVFGSYVARDLFIVVEEDDRLPRC